MILLVLVCCCRLEVSRAHTVVCSCVLAPASVAELGECFLQHPSQPRNASFALAAVEIDGRFIIVKSLNSWSCAD